MTLERLLARLLSEFAKATDPQTRDRLALELADTEMDEAKEAIVKALRDPATKGHRGTLVYALQGFECGDIVPELIECVVVGSYEECEHAVTILHCLDAINDVEDRAVCRAAYERLDDARSWVSGWRQLAIRECLPMFKFAAV